MAINDFVRLTRFEAQRSPAKYGALVGHGYTQRQKGYNADATGAGVEAAREVLAKLA